ncbi:MAG: diacylglycerol kinase [Oligoflexia bacterium]|nr:diacylglycerol kinase [Oligoflexia bacterium]
MKYLLIMNPGSRDGRSKKNFETIFSLLDSFNLDYQFKYTSKLEDAYQFSLEANQSNTYDVIVAVGGDGTINGVLSGFYDKDGNRICKKSKMAIIYTGTSPDFCLSYNIPLKLERAVELLAKLAKSDTSYNSNSQKISIGQINYTNGEDINVGYFGCCANIGIGAKVAEGANRGIRKKIGDVAGTFLSLVKALIDYKATDFKVRVIDADGKSFTNRVEKVINMFIGRTYYVASGIKVANKLNFADEMDDKKFFLLIVNNLRIKSIMGLLKILYSGKPFQNRDDLKLSYIEKIRIDCDTKDREMGMGMVEFDGDFKGYLPCEIKMAKDKLDLITDNF